MSERRTDRRRALVVGPAFFGYEHDIVSELERQGYATEFLDERPSNSSVARAVLRVRKSLIARSVERHFREAAARVSDNDFDLVLVIKGEVVPRWFVELLRQRNPRARFVFYTFDSLANSSNCLELLDCFDARLSFDRDDVEKDDRFSYLPLFYTPEFSGAASARPMAERRHTLTFVGTLHSERYAFAQRLFAGRAGTYAFFYVPARWYFAVTKYLTRENRSVPWRDVTFRPMRKRDIADAFFDSRAVLDVQRLGQVGLTMRTFEVLAAGAILVTTNPAIKRESFYDEDRIVVVGSDWDATRLSQELDRRGTAAGPPAGFDAYSLASWVARISLNPA